MPVRFHADRVDAGVGTAAAGHLFQRVEDVDLLVVDRLGAGLVPRHLQPVGEAVDGDHPLGAEQEGAGDRELADRAAAPDGDHVARLDVAHLGAHVAGRQDVGEEQHLLVGHARPGP